MLLIIKDKLENSIKRPVILEKTALILKLFYMFAFVEIFSILILVYYYF